MTLAAPTVNVKWTSAAQTGTTLTATSASFTPPANALLEVGVTINRSDTTSDTRVTSVVTSGYTWTKQAQSSWTGSTSATVPAGGTAQAGTGTEIWTTTTGAAPAAMTVAVTGTVSAASRCDIFAQVVMYTDDSGSAPVPGAAGTASSGSGTPAKAVTAAAGSYLTAARSDWAAAGALTLRTVANGTSPPQTAIYNDAGSSATFSDAFWRTTGTVSAGTVTMDATLPAAENYNMAVLEVQVPGGGAAAFTMPAPRIVGQAVQRAANW